MSEFRAAFHIANALLGTPGTGSGGSNRHVPNFRAPTTATSG
jgi:hypothetical protein